MNDPKMISGLTNPYAGIVAVCPKCDKEVSGDFGSIGVNYRQFNCWGCGLQYTIPASDIEGAMIGDKFVGEATNFKKKAASTRAARASKFEKPKPTQTLPQQKVEQKQPETENPLIQDALRRAESVKRKNKATRNPIISTFNNLIYPGRQ